jgi:phage regulator Rha-like protein
MFQLTTAEFKRLRCQSGTSKNPRGGRRYAPFAFTEHGVVMAANVLNSKRAIAASVQVVRAFVRLRQLLATHAGLRRKLEELELKYDRQFAAVFDAIRELMEPCADSAKGPIGFQRGP